MNSSLSVAVVGARGYSGLELCRLLLDHPQVHLSAISSTQEFQLCDELPARANIEKSRSVPWVHDQQILLNPPDLVFLATPAEVSLALAPKLIKAGCSVIDLSGAFRLKTSSYASWYKIDHTENSLLQRTSYGLVPFAAPVTSREPFLIANPGCYATAILMALLPLLKEKRIEMDHIVIDAKSGATGAGRKATENLLFSEISESVSAYRVGRHQHIPEVQECISQLCGMDVQFSLATHLLPIKRGLMASLYLKTSASRDEIKNCYEKFYQNYPLVRIFSDVERGSRLDQVVHSPRTHISFELVDSRLYVTSTIDNLLKGAASQAIENMNRAYDFPVEMGLLP